MTSKGPSQTDRFLRALHNAGPRGITRLDFEVDPVIDGGPKILRVARCAGDLKDRGIHVVSDPHGGTGNCAVYWLREHAPVGVVRHDGQPDKTPEPSREGPAAGFTPVTCCLGCRTNHRHGFVCPHGRPTETMLVSGRMGVPITDCKLVQSIAPTHQEVRRAA